MDIKHQYNEIGKQYVEGQESFFDKREDWSRVVAMKYFEEIIGKKILDIGCGSGIDFKIFESKGADVFGIDPSKVMVDMAKQNAINPDKIQIGEYENIPFPDGTFNIVFGRFSLHYLNNFDKAYQEIHRVLVPGGKILLIVSHPAFDLTYLIEEEHKNNDLVTIELYENRTKISYPPHSFQDYFSSKFFELFDLIGLNEYTEDEIRDKDKKIPGALLYCAQTKFK